MWQWNGLFPIDKGVMKNKLNWLIFIHDQIPLLFPFRGFLIDVKLKWNDHLIQRSIKITLTLPQSLVRETGRPTSELRMA